MGYRAVINETTGVGHVEYTPDYVPEEKKELSVDFCESGPTYNFPSEDEIRDHFRNKLKGMTCEMIDGSVHIKSAPVMQPSPTLYIHPSVVIVEEFDISKPKVETTYSAVFEIDGQTIEIPAPKESDGWGVVEDVDIEQYDPEEIITLYGDKNARFEIEKYDGTECIFYIEHQNGQIMASEYEAMVDENYTELKSLTKHQRTIQPPEQYNIARPNHAERCVTETGNLAATLKGWPKRRPSGAVKVKGI